MAQLYGGTLTIPTKLSPAIREVVLKALYHAETRDVPPRVALNGFFRRYAYSDRDKAFATEMVYGTIRWRRRLDWMVSQLMRGNPDSLTPWIRHILRMGLYQLMMMSQVPDAAATHEAVKLARRYGHQGTVRLTNAIMRTAIRKRDQLDCPNYTGDPIKQLGITHSYPAWLTKRWVERYGIEGTANLMEAGNQTPPLTIRVNIDRITPRKLIETLKKNEIHVESSRWLEDFLSIRHTGDLNQLSCHQEGLFQVQDESAGLAVRLLDPKQDETIIDLCCAPGGKTTYIAQFVSAGGQVVACDTSLHRLRQVEENRQRMGLAQVHLVVMDGKSPALAFEADRVMIDAPCSGLGTIARRPDLRWRRRMEDIGRLHDVQLALLKRGAGLVKKGGILVYSTCTIEPEENEDVVAAFCSKHPGFHIEKPDDWPVEMNEVMNDEGQILTLPSVHGIDGSFAVRLRRES